MVLQTGYSNDSLAALRAVSGAASAERAAQAIQQQVARHFGLHAASVESLHIGGAFIIELSAAGSTYYLKFTTRGMQRRPEHLFPWLGFVRQHGLPLPEIVPTQDGIWWVTPLEESAYDTGYLMRACAGTPLSTVGETAVDQYIEAMAALHDLGTYFPQAGVASEASWNRKWAERERLQRDLATARFVSPGLVARAMQLIEQTGPHVLPATMIHGDFRLWHVLFQSNTLSGIIGVDHATDGERWVDLCYGLFCGPVPESGAVLPFPLVRRALQHYDRHVPLTERERAMLKAGFAYAALETLRDLEAGLHTGSDARQAINATQDLFDAIYATPIEALLAPV